MTKNSNAPAVAEQTSAAPVVSGFGTADGFALIQRQANLLASSSLVPKEYQGNVPNCVIALNMANRIGADPLMAIQNLYVVHGRPGWSSQFLIACFNQNPAFSALRYEFKGEEGKDSWACRAYAVEKATETVLYGTWISIALAKAEGWEGKDRSKWKTMPEQMLRYRAAAWFIRAYAPEIAMGLHTADELREIDMERGQDGTFATAQDINDKLMGEAAAAPQEQPEADPVDMVTCPMSGEQQPASECADCAERASCSIGNAKEAA